MQSMTGGEWKIMLLKNNIIKIGASLLFIFFAPMTMGGMEVIYKATFVPPPCTLIFPNGNIIELGRLKVGVSKHASFPVTINCENHNIRPTLIARVSATAENVIVNTSGEKVFMKGGTGTGDQPQFWLEGEEGKPISLQGKDFCSTTFNASTKPTHECYLSPVTEVSAKSTKGKMEAVVKFTLTLN